MRLLLRIAAVALLLLPLTCLAGLKWENDSAEIAVDRPAEKVSAVFPFRNGIGGATTILDVRASCRCTLVNDLKEVYQSGERGELAVTFVIGDRKGRQDTSIIVTESDGKETSHTVLKLRVNLPDTIHLSKEMLTWEIGDPLDAQELQIKIHDPEKTKLAGIRSMSPMFQVEQEVLGAGGEVRVKVRPSSTDKAVSGSLRIDILDPEARTLFFPLRVR